MAWPPNSYYQGQSDALLRLALSQDVPILAQELVLTAAEGAAGVTPVNFGYLPGDVRRYGAVPDSGATDNGPPWTVAASCNQNVFVPVDGTGSYGFASAAALGSAFFDYRSGAATSGAFQSSTLSNGPNSGGEQYIHQALGSDLATIYIRRQAQSSAYGAGAGANPSALRIYSYVSTTGTGSHNSETTIIGSMQNTATSGSQVGIYAQGWRNATNASATWAFVSEGRDTTGASDPTKPLIGSEFDIFATGTDVHLQRYVSNFVIGPHGASAAPTVGWGLLFTAFNDNIANGTYVNVIAIATNASVGLGVGLTHNSSATPTIISGIELAHTGTWGIQYTGTQTVGADFSGGTFATAAIRLAADQVISLEGTDVYNLLFHGSTNSLQYKNGANVLMAITAAGQLTLTPTSGKALAITGTGAGAVAWSVGSSATTGAQIATFAATNKPGSGTTSPSAWLPIACDGTTYYMPLWQ